jgi:hypothetical protein
MGDMLELMVATAAQYQDCSARQAGLATWAQQSVDAGL